MYECAFYTYQGSQDLESTRYRRQSYQTLRLWTRGMHHRIYLYLSTYRDLSIVIYLSIKTSSKRASERVR